MRLTAFSDVSLRIMMLLAASKEQKLSTQAIAQAIGTPYNHVAKSVAFLSHRGWVEATRGRSGGVALSGEGHRVTVGQILRITEGDVPMIECESHEGNCPLDYACRLRFSLSRAREAFLKELDPVVVSQLPTEKQMGPVFVELGLGPLAQTKKLASA